LPAPAAIDARLSYAMPLFAAAPAAMITPNIFFDSHYAIASWLRRDITIYFYAAVLLD
jgi:hypothetical protein